MEKVKVEYVYGHDGKSVGDTAEVEVGEAKRLTRAGVAVPATKPAAKAAGLDPETAATAKG